MDKGPAPTEWDIVNSALLGVLLGMLVGVLFSLCQVVMSPTHDVDPHLVRDPAVGGVVGVLLFSSLAKIRNRIMRARYFR
jgi:xanthosine utilization system XapX-like protein